MEATHQQRGANYRTIYSCGRSIHTIENDFEKKGMGEVAYEWDVLQGVRSVTWIVVEASARTLGDS